MNRLHAKKEGCGKGRQPRQVSLRWGQLSLVGWGTAGSHWRGPAPPGPAFWWGYPKTLPSCHVFLLEFQWPVTQANCWCGYRITTFPSHCQLLYGALWRYSEGGDPQVTLPVSLYGRHICHLATWSRQADQLPWPHEAWSWEYPFKYGDGNRQLIFLSLILTYTTKLMTYWTTQSAVNPY